MVLRGGAFRPSTHGAGFKASSFRNCGVRESGLGLLSIRGIGRQGSLMPEEPLNIQYNIVQYHVAWHGTICYDRVEYNLILSQCNTR